jgi:hypothetical protein
LSHITYPLTQSSFTQDWKMESDLSGASKDYLSLVDAQLYGIHSISSQQEAFGTTPSQPSVSHWHFTTSDFTELVEALNLPFFDTRGEMRAHDGLVGRGGFAAVKRTDITSKDGAGATAVAIKELRPKPGDLDYSASREQLKQVPEAPITQAYLELCIMKHPVIAKNPFITRLMGITQNSFDTHSRLDYRLSAWCLNIPIWGLSIYIYRA